jgi:allantoinase
VSADLVLRGHHVVLPHSLGPAAVRVRDGVIAEVAGYDEVPADAVPIEIGDAVLMPGLVDTHVHVNDPGRADWEGFAHATRAAAAGGVTTLIDMPLNSIPATIDVCGLEAKRRAAEGRCHVDVGFWGGVVPGNAGDLEALWEAGAFGFKCFLAPSGVDEFAHVGEAELRAAMPVLAELGAPLLVHAELAGWLARATVPAAAADRARYGAYLASRPPAFEIAAIEMLVRLCREFRTRIHVVHLSAAEALPLLRAARAEGLPISVETCPHYLHFAAEDIPPGATEFKCGPPIRERDNRERLWTALGTGLIDLVASDHSPCPPALKARDSGDLFAAWGGIASLQLALPVVWRSARERGYTAQHLAEWMSAAPARLAGLGHRKGGIEVGRDADLVAWDPDDEFLVDGGMLHQRHTLSPYLGSILPGVVRATWVRGRCVFRRGEPMPGPAGSILLRGAT